ncbi:hypothetical protein CU669_20250 [Paramagnetospirillum kuznetsovii]|uniref:Pentapeptide repeat-containing protein n=1 Tax=Paramagnetospirillum kuznetsovii TaxID=2053833 RepID=A0A364NSK8_9PROT|nr:pentapeptide repeat-containing protein [Paramagnetospirillum kuznetsovii]RAU20081.1 hypothetical protein CU669_20250 [Paramagnetospirillum kuznetsovii]
MGNVHHLQHLGQGAGDWNAWRQQEPDVRPDLTNANLRGANLAGMDLSGSLLSLANLRKAVLSGANLRDCNLPRACLEDADLSGAKLQGANLAGATLLRANFSGANMRMANLAGANLAGKMDLSGVDLTGANLAGAKLMGANFSGATLAGANLAGADARNANFTGADLTDAVTAGALLDGANMSGAVIRRTAGRPQATVTDLGLEPEPEQSPPPRTVSERPQPVSVETFEADDFDATPDSVVPPSNEIESVFEAEQVFETEPGWDNADEPEIAEPEQEPELCDALVDEPADLEPEPMPEPEPAAVEEMVGDEDVAFDAPPMATVAAMPLAESQISDLLADSGQEEAPSHVPAPVYAEPQDSPFYTYESKELAILALYLDQVSRKTSAEKAMLLDLLVQYNRNFLGQDVSVPMTTSGNAILVGFGDPTDALRCGGLYISMLRDMQVESYVAVNWSMATVRVDPEGSESDELIANSISPSARLMPVGVVGEVLVLEELYSNPLTQRDLFTFERVARKWKAANDTHGEGIDVICYSVRSKQPPRP